MKEKSKRKDERRKVRMLVRNIVMEEARKVEEK